MKLYENQKPRTKRCGYCRAEGHTRLECPEVAKDWESWKHFKVPERTQGWYRSRNHPKYWGEWYTDCMNTLSKQEAKLKQQMSGTPVVRAAPKCGFCGGKDHNRRNCPTMKQFIKDCVAANTNYRKQIHDYFVKQLGFDVGAAIEIKHRSGYGSQQVVATHVGLITKINWDKVNIFCSVEGYGTLSEKYGQEFKVFALVDGKEVPVSLRKYIQTDTKARLLVQKFGYQWHSMDFEAIIGKSESPLPEDWTTSYKEAWDFLTKKRSYQQLKDDGVIDLINKWVC